MDNKEEKDPEIEQHEENEKEKEKEKERENPEMLEKQVSKEEKEENTPSEKEENEKSREEEKENEDEEEIPSDKDSLITFLVNRLKASEEKLNALTERLDKEKNKRSGLKRDFRAKNGEMEDLSSNESKIITERVKTELRGTINKAVEEKIKAEKELENSKKQMIEMSYLIEEQDFQFSELRKEFFRVSRENEMLTTDNQSEKLRALQLEEDLQNAKEEISSKDFEISRQKEEIEELKVTMAKLSDVRNVLNRVYSNLESKRGITEIEKPKSREHNIKKEAFLTNDDDFWYTDNEQNNNNRTYSGRKIQLPPINLAQNKEEMEYTRLSDKSKKKKW